MSDAVVTDSPRPGRVGRWSAGLRQRSFPVEFRIGPPAWPHEWHAALHRIGELNEEIRANLDTQAGLAAQQRATPPAPPPPSPPGIDEGALVTAAMGVWRTQRRLDTAGDDGGALARQLRRHLAVAWDGLAELEIEARTHDHEPFDQGMSVEVLAFEPQSGLGRETIIRTVQPTILRSGRMIQMAQVVVGQPEGGSDR